jgi:phage gp29-like protein
MESIFWGHSLVQYGAIVDDKPESVELVPREYVVPERHGVMRRLYRTNDLVDYERAPFNNWIVEVGKRDDLGLLLKATPHAIWKKNATGSWSEFVELFGQPTRIGKTHSSNKENRENLESMLANMGSSAWGVFDTDDELQLIESNKTDAHETFQELILQANAEMSKLIVGQTMTADNGSSRSQGEVHERILNDYFKHDLMFVSHVVNNKLIPMLIKQGVKIEGLKFKFDTTEKLGLTGQFDIDKELLKSYKIEPEYFAKKYGTPVEEVEFKPTQQQVENEFFKNSIHKYYE